MQFSSSFLRRMSSNIDMKMFRSTKFSGLMLFSSKSFWMCQQNTLTRHIFSCFTALILMTHMTWLKFGCPRTSSHVSSACCVLLDSLRLSLLLFTVSHLPFHSPDLPLHLHLPCGVWFEWNKNLAYSCE